MMDNSDKFLVILVAVAVVVVVSILVVDFALSSVANEQCVILGYDMGRAEGFKQVCKNIEVVPLNEALRGG
jgi:hypothetical protein